MARHVLYLAILVSMVFMIGCADTMQAVISPPQPTPKCNESADCPVGRYCNRGLCLAYEANVPCSGVGECSYQQVCIDGRCVNAVGWACEKNEECGEGQVCKDGYCTYYGEQNTS